MQININLHAKILKQQKIILAYGDDPDGKLDTLHKINIHLSMLTVKCGS